MGSSRDRLIVINHRKRDATSSSIWDSLQQELAEKNLSGALGSGFSMPPLPASLLIGSSNLGGLAPAPKLIVVLQRQGFSLDAVTFNAVLYAFAKTGRVNDFDEVKRQMRDIGCSADEVTYNIMVSMLLIDVMGKAGMVKEVEQVFQEMSDLQGLSHIIEHSVSC
ncbi:hypothetical protein GOP47_0016946 [Adiantum capillus-veneris]|uniref:Pentatricopeptide repeat-containing protein n=1 Tax=Adiantum capillus-veneris TaxID=13818 RepID=A0A9D4UIM6_ADICA|nr:hypothetical protein GOP47_0016946 [Adiantum capillus-veneris]